MLWSVDEANLGVHSQYVDVVSRYLHSFESAASCDEDDDGAAHHQSTIVTFIFSGSLTIKA